MFLQTSFQQDTPLFSTTPYTTFNYSSRTDVPIQRVKEYSIFVELCRLNSYHNPITCVVMLRVFIETTLKQCALLMEIKWTNIPETSKKICKILLEENLIDASIKLIITKYADEKNSFFAFSNIQSYVHSVRFHPNQQTVNTYWDELDPFLAACWDYINLKSRQGS